MMFDLIKKIFHFLFDKSNIDCVNCIYGTSTGKGICEECDGRYFEEREEVPIEM